MNKRLIIKYLKRVWVICGLVFLAWQFYSFQSHGVDNFMLDSTSDLAVENTDHFYSFTPTSSFRNVMVFFPGAMVDPKAYVPLCRNIAKGNVQVYLLKMPWRQATKGYEMPIELKLMADSTKAYTLAGHSQGAKMAAQFVHENPGLVDKLVLIGTTHPRDYSLANQSIAVMKIYGSHDGVASESDINKNRDKLPKNTMYIKIAGGNHAQFGYYGCQLGDNKAAISREEQQQMTLKAIEDFLNHNVHL